MKRALALLTLLVSAMPGASPAALVQKPPTGLSPQPLPAACGLISVSHDWDFALNDQGFQVANCDGTSSPGLWQYGSTSIVPGAPGHVWGTVLNTNYTNSSGEGLLSPWFTVSMTTRFVEVYHWFSTEAAYDGCNVSVGSGWPSSTIISPVAGYTTTQISSSPTYYALCVDGEPGWTGLDATWRVDCFDLTPFMNQYIRLEFDFGSDASVTAPGWYLSRVRVGLPSLPTGACCNYQNGSCYVTTQSICIAAEGGPGEWHGEWTTCSPNPCPQPITHGGVTLGGWSGAEPWHDWVSSVPGTTVALEVSPGDAERHIDSVDFYTSTDLGWNWQYQGTDTDGTEPHLNTTDLSVTPAGDGWSATVSVPNLPDYWPLLFKAKIHTDSGERVAEGEIATDPAPPSLGTCSVQDWVVTDRDTLGPGGHPKSPTRGHPRILHPGLIS